MNIKLDKHQLVAIDKLRTGSILNGGVGSGKSRAAIAYYFLRIGQGSLRINEVGEYSYMKKPKHLYIITTARKRDTLEWEEELVPFGMSTKNNPLGVEVVIDSWNNIKKYIAIENAFFIFDEQRVVGSGAWVKAFLKIVKKNEWILLSATPGDTWLDYVPVFVANGYYKNRTEFIRKHVVYNSYVKYPMVDRYLEVGTLTKLRNEVLVKMKYTRHTTRHYKLIWSEYDKTKYDILFKKRWNIYKDKPIRNVSELGYALRKLINSDDSRINNIKYLTTKHDKLIIFYNFDYELEILKNIGMELGIPTTEWNGHKHELIPKTDSWIYLVQYNSNSEGWNCIETNAMIFYSQNYSYKTLEQSSGRIDRRNTPFENLYYYRLLSKAPMDLAIKKTLDSKKNFNESDFLQQSCHA